MFKKITKRNKIIILVIGGLSVLLLILLMFCIFENSKKTSTPKPSLSNKVSELRQTLDLDEYTVPKIKEPIKNKFKDLPELQDLLKEQDLKIEMINENKQAKLTVDNKYSDEIIFELNAFSNTELWKRISIISLGLLDNNNPETIKEKILSKNELLRGNEDKFSVELQNENTTIPGIQIKEGSALIKSDKYLGRTVVKFLFR